MTQHLKQEFDDLKERLLVMAGMASSAVANAVQALNQRDDALADRVEAEDSDIDRMEMEMDRVCVQLLSKAPLARDLRLITVSLKICTDLERVGDEATTIARRTRELNAEPPSERVRDLREMARIALEMMNSAFKAFVEGNLERAQAVIPRDKTVDRLNKEVCEALAKDMRSDPDSISRSLNLMTISKSLERVADHAKNVAEEAVYLYQARDIRHPESAVSNPAAENTPRDGV